MGSIIHKCLKRLQAHGGGWGGWVVAHSLIQGPASRELTVTSVSEEGLADLVWLEFLRVKSSFVAALWAHFMKVGLWVVA